MALYGPPSLAWVTQLQHIWDMGDAALPVDIRLPQTALEQLLKIMAPAEVVEVSSSGAVTSHNRGGALPVEEGDALVMTTSGTTGVPKGAVLTHGAVKASAQATSRRLSVDSTIDHWLACLPLSHVGGLSVVTRALHTNTRLSVHPNFEANAVLAAAAGGVTHISLVATALARLDASVFKRIVLGGSAPPPNLPPNVVTTYGMTETGSGVVYDGQPLDGVELRIVDHEIQLRGPMLLRAYRDESHPFTDDGWLRTGDHGAISPSSGLLSVEGRVGDLIITGGENVWPTPVEARLEEHPAIREAAVVGEPDEEWGQRVVAVVVWESGHPGVPLVELRNFIKETLPAHCAPKELLAVARLPRTAIGKLARSNLKTGGLFGARSQQ